MFTTTCQFRKLSILLLTAAISLAHISSCRAADSQTVAPTVLFQSDGTNIAEINKLLYSNNVTGYWTTIKPELSTVLIAKDWPSSPAPPHAGPQAIRFSGTANGGDSTFCCMQAYNVAIAVDKTTTLSYWLYPQYENSKFEKVDLHCTDGSTFHAAGGVYTFTDTLAPNHIAGEVPINAWSKISCNVGQILAGKTIDAIWIVYDRTGSRGQFRGYIDHVTITSSMPNKE